MKPRIKLRAIRFLTYLIIITQDALGARFSGCCLHYFDEYPCFYLQTDVLFCRVIAGLRRFILGLIYLTAYSVLQPKVKENYLITEEYDVS